MQNCSKCGKSEGMDASTCNDHTDDDEVLPGECYYCRELEIVACERCGDAMCYAPVTNDACARLVFDGEQERVLCGQHIEARSEPM